MNMLQTIISVFLFCPFLLFIMVVMIEVKRTKQVAKAVGRAADGTTLLLIFAIPLYVEALTGYAVGFATAAILVIVASFFTIGAWRHTQELKFSLWFKKLWRIYFIGLSALYIIIFVVGLLFMMVQPIISL